MPPKAIEFLLYPGFNPAPHQAVIAQGIAAVTNGEYVVGAEAGNCQQGSIDCPTNKSLINTRAYDADPISCEASYAAIALLP